MLKDRYEQILTTRSGGARDAYIDGVDGLFSATPFPEASFEQALSQDNQFAMAHIGLARALQLSGRMPEARKAASQARQWVQSATAREQAHVETIALMLDGKAPEALTLLLGHLGEFPRDAVILSLALGAFGLYAFSGRADHEDCKLALCERLATHYGDDWWFLTFLGWSHTEAGNLEIGRKITQKAMDLRPESAHGAHAIAHSFFERGDTEGGIDFLETWLPGYDRRGLLHAHLAWHLALLKLAKGDDEHALALYDKHIAPRVSLAPPILVISDGASLFWRMELINSASRPSADELIDYVRTSLPHATHPFIDVHCVMAAALAEDHDLIDQRLQELQNLHQDGRLAAGELIPALCRILRAFAHQDYDEVIATLAPRLNEIVCFGGSKAQREVFEDTLVVAYLRSGRKNDAAALLRQRLERRPSERDSQWMKGT